MKKILLYLILVMAVGMAGIVAYVSVGGLLKVFSGAGTLGLLFFSAIEIAKIVATSAIHTYGKKIGLIYKGLLSLGIGIAMIITSVGIYGFLSSTYKETFMKLENVEAQVSLLTKKRDGFQGQLDNVNKEKESIDTRISELSSGLSNNVIQYKDPETGQIITTTSSSTRKSLEKQIESSQSRLDNINIKYDELNTKVFELDNQIVEVKLGNDSAAELGPLKYLSEVTGKSMDEVMKYFIFLLIIIGDPMAVLMVIVFNKIVRKNEDEEPILPAGNELPKEVKEVMNNAPTTPAKQTFTIPVGELSEEEINDMVKGIADRFKRPVEFKEEVIVDSKTGQINLPYQDEDYKAFTTPSTNEAPLPWVSEKEVLEALKEEDEEDEDEYPEPTQALRDVAERYKEIIEEPKVDPKITIDDIKEKKLERERGFSVVVPERKKTNTVDRIGSNKEIRDGNNDAMYFKRRG